MQKELLRQKLSDDHKNHYTYGKDYLSLSMAMVNEEQLAHTAKIETQSKFLDARGFVYPAVRAGKECNEHPKKLPEATVEVPPRISARTHPPTHPPTPPPPCGGGAVCWRWLQSSRQSAPVRAQCRAMHARFATATGCARTRMRR